MRRIVTAGAVCLLAALVSGCGGTGFHRDPAATARLDRETGQVVLPLDEFALSLEGERIMASARLAILRSCLQPRGHNGVEPPAMGPAAPTEERPYGLWLVDRAHAYGPHVPPARQASDTQTLPGGGSDESGPAFNATDDECASKVGDRLIEVSTPPDGGVILSIETQAASLAAQDPQWEAARSEWHRCLRESGLTPREEEGAWLGAESAALADMHAGSADDAATAREEIRLGVLEATCNEVTELTQRLGDIEAGYQATLVKQHETAHMTERDTNARHLDAAREYLANHQ